MTAMSHETFSRQVKISLRTINKTWEQLQEKTGLSSRTINRIKEGIREDEGYARPYMPSYKTMTAIRNALTDWSRKR